MFGREISMSIAANIDTGISILPPLPRSPSMASLAGWSSNNKYATMGGIRSSAQMISYELALGLSWVGPIMLAGSMSLQKIVDAQANSLWYIALQPVAAIIFFVAVLAEINRSPFDMPEAEQELTAGYHTEYSGMKFALFMMTEYIKMIVVSVIGATLFLGGYLGPGLIILGLALVRPAPGLFWLFLKVFGLLFFMVWLRATTPRIRYDRLMAFG
jgi:NADH-quinone oxidoreductase subunit H